MVHALFLGRQTRTGGRRLGSYHRSQDPQTALWEVTIGLAGSENWRGWPPVGPYVNRNHFAGFVDLTPPTGLSRLVFRSVRRDVFPVSGPPANVPLGALILSGSRGGIVSFAF